MARRLTALLVALAAAAAVAPATAGAVSSSRIVGGTETERPWPFMVYLEAGRAEIEVFDAQFCGGTLIAPTWVLTAAHCVNTLPAGEPLVLTVVRGRHARSDTRSGERIQARRVIQHPAFASEGEADHDAMLVELARRASGTPVQIAHPAEGDLWGPGRPATILGWGATSSGGDDSDVLREGRVPIVSDADCAEHYDWTDDFHAPTMVCAGHPGGGTDTCQGDSGGPLLVEDGRGGWRQVGITSWGQDCGQAGYPGVYAEAAGDVLRGWIARHVPGAIAPPPPPPPPPSTSPSPEAGDERRAKRRRPCSRRKTRKARRACRRARERREAARRDRD